MLDENIESFSTWDMQNKTDKLINTVQLSVGTKESWKDREKIVWLLER